MLPKAVKDALTDDQRRYESKKKREGTRKGKQHVPRGKTAKRFIKGLKEDELEINLKKPTQRKERVKNQKVLLEDYTQMKTQKILFQLNLKLLKT